LLVRDEGVLGVFLAFRRLHDFILKWETVAIAHSKHLRRVHTVVVRHCPLKLLDQPLLLQTEDN